LQVALSGLETIKTVFPHPVAVIIFPPSRLENSGGFFIPNISWACFDMQTISAIFQREVITAGVGKLVNNYLSWFFFI